MCRHSSATEKTPRGSACFVSTSHVLQWTRFVPLKSASVDEGVTAAASTCATWVNQRTLTEIKRATVAFMPSPYFLNSETLWRSPLLRQSFPPGESKLMRVFFTAFVVVALGVGGFFLW